MIAGQPNQMLNAHRVQFENLIYNYNRYVLLTSLPRIDKTEDKYKIRVSTKEMPLKLAHCGIKPYNPECIAQVPPGKVNPLTASIPEPIITDGDGGGKTISIKDLADLKNYKLRKGDVVDVEL